MEKEKNHSAVSFSDSEFLSLLYSERERENSLNRVPGWSSWAILGAGITVLCAGYAVLKRNRSIDGSEVLYTTSANLAFLLTLISMFRLLNLNRSVDLSRVKLLKEVLPSIQFAFVIGGSVIMAVMVAIVGAFNLVFWSWISLLFVYCVALVVAIFLGKTIVPAYYYDVFFPWEKANMVFESILTALYLFVFKTSSKYSSTTFLSSEFELSVCIASLIALAFIFFKTMSKDDVVKRIDVIIEGFLYRGVSKQESFHQLSVNRWGYTVIDACSQELNEIKIKFGLHSEDIKDLEAIEQTTVDEDVNLDQIDTFLQKLDKILLHQKEILDSSKKLTKRIKQILKAAPLLKDTTELDYLLVTNEDIHNRVDESLLRVTNIMKRLKERQKQIQKEIVSS